MESGWPARRVARQLGRSDCVVRRCWDQWIRKMSITRRPGSDHPRQTSCREDCNILRNVRVQPTASSATIQAQWCCSRGNWTTAEWNQVVFSDESRFNLSSDDNHVLVWRRRGERLNPAFPLQRHTAPKAGIMFTKTESAITVQRAYRIKFGCQQRDSPKLNVFVPYLGGKCMGLSFSEN
ncbi:transposable element Tcb2 transposase [Trichonephila clavipes]|nr:transposable element Tcb2 transposase [Trichonephila clavipes]